MTPIVLLLQVKSYIYSGDIKSESTAGYLYKYSISNNVITRQITSSTLDETNVAKTVAYCNGYIYLFGGNTGSSPLSTSVTSNNKIYVFNFETVQELNGITISPSVYVHLCPISERAVYLMSGSSYWRTSNTIHTFTVNTVLNKDVLNIITQEEHTHPTKIINTDSVIVETGVIGCYLGDNNNIAQLVDAYIYNDIDNKWETLDGVSVTQDMLNALNIMGVT